MLKISHITKTFGLGTTDAKKVLDELSLDVRRGDFITIIGANGAGKSTLLGAIAGSFITDSGELVLDGEDMTLLPEYRRARKIGRLLQDPMRGSAPDMTIEENLALAAGRGGWLSPVSRADRRFFRRAHGGARSGDGGKGAGADEAHRGRKRPDLPDGHAQHAVGAGAWKPHGHDERRKDRDGRFR